MPQEVTIWGIKNLKKTEKMNHDTGVKQDIKRCTGVIEFPVLADQAGIYEDKKVFIYTEAEHEEAQKGRNTTLDMIYEKQDAILDLTLIISKVIKDMNQCEESGNGADRDLKPIEG